MNRRLKILDQIIYELKTAKTVAVTGHMRPDGDCIGSQLAVAYALKNSGKKVTVYNEDEMPKKLAFLDPKRTLSRPKNPFLTTVWL